MNKALFNIEALQPYLQPGNLVLTPNQRLAAKIHQAYGLHQHHNGVSAWLTPAIKPLKGWLEECWLNLQDAGFAAIRHQSLLTTEQEALLWQNIVNESEYGELLLRPDQAAAAAQQAHQLLVQWQIKLDAELLNESEDKKAFQQWQAEFIRRCQSQHWVGQGQFSQDIILGMQAAALSRVQNIYLVGFNDLTPLFVSTLNAAAHHWQQLDVQLPAPLTVIRTECSNTEHEIKTAAHWAREILRQEKNHAAICIIVPDLSTQKNRVERIFTEVFEPHYTLPTEPPHALPFNFSAGSKLSEAPIIKAALELLQLNREEIQLERCCNLLHNPFFGFYDEELQIRVNIEDKLRSFASDTLSVAKFRQVCAEFCAAVRKTAQHTEHPQQQQLEFEAASAPGSTLASRLQKFDEYSRLHSGHKSHKRMPSQWRPVFEQQLKVLHWPGERRLNSNEYQQVSHFFQLLEDLTTFDHLLGAVDLHAMLSFLQRQVAATTFQAKTEDSPIQVLGTLEAAGLHFTHLWVTGLTEKVWPAAPAPNPFIPLALQREKQMPHADYQRELEYAKKLLAGFNHSAPTVIYSYATQDNETANKPSPLIESLALIDVAELLGGSALAAQQPHLYQTLIAAHSTLTCIDFSQGPTIAAGELQRIKGGSSIFRDQAICPFNSFALHRLGVRQPKQTSYGLNAIERGNLLHTALEIFWHEMKSHANLIQLSDEQLTQRVDQVVQLALESIFNQLPRPMGIRYRELEQERLNALLIRWLDVEKSRAPFEVIATEKTLAILIEEIPITLRIDRIDQLPDGSRLLIDYKSGEISLSNWSGPRPDEPQLPLYSICDDESVDVICFARVSPKGMEFKGLGRLENSALSGIYSAASHKLDLPQTWEEINDHWRDVLTKLAAEFLRGNSTVDYKSAQQSQYYAYLAPLNRSNEQASIERWRQQLDEKLNHQHLNHQYKDVN